MQNLNSVLLERLGQLEAEQGRMAVAILDLQRRVEIADAPVPAKTTSADSIATWSAGGVNMRLPQIGQQANQERKKC